MDIKDISKISQIAKELNYIVLTIQGINNYGAQVYSVGNRIDNKYLDIPVINQEVIRQLSIRKMELISELEKLGITGAGE